MQTYQEFQTAVSQGRLTAYIGEAIQKHIASQEYNTAIIANEYDAQRNTNIIKTARYFYSLSGKQTIDYTASNNRIASNFFHRLNNQRCAYSLGNGVTFDVDGIKEQLGTKFDTDIFRIGLNALIHGVTFGFRYVKGKEKRIFSFPITEFVPFWDESSGDLMAGIRFWCIEKGKKPTYAVLYEKDGYTKYQSESNTGLSMKVIQEKRPYLYTYQYTKAEGDVIIDASNYISLPIVPMYANRQKQSTLVGMKGAIDSYDLIQSGFANDLADCAQMYWIVGNALGMDDADVQKMLDRMRIAHVVVADTDNSTVTPYTQEIPYNAREAYLTRIQSSIYRDFGAFNPETVAAGAITATQINSAYQPMDEEADVFEYEVIEFIQKILALDGLSATPQFKRNRISNVSEQVTNVIQEAQFLDDETILSLLPNITPDMIPTILAKRDAQDGERWVSEQEEATEV